MALFIAFIFLIIFFIIGYLIQYSMIDKYAIYFSSRNNIKERVTIIDKNLFYVTIGYMYKNPETITTLDFLLNYRRY